MSHFLYQHQVVKIVDCLCLEAHIGYVVAFHAAQHVLQQYEHVLVEDSLLVLTAHLQGIESLCYAEIRIFNMCEYIPLAGVIPSHSGI